jgi:hypothetical protein
LLVSVNCHYRPGKNAVGSRPSDSQPRLKNRLQ